MINERWLCVTMMDIAPEVEQDWSEWYSKIYIPQILTVPGFLVGRHFTALLGTPKYMSMYDLAGPSVVESSELQAMRGSGPFASHVSNIRLTIYRQIFPDNGSGFVAHFNRPYLFLTLTNVASEVEAAWNRWYNERHIPVIDTVGLLNGHRYLASSGPWKYMALYGAERADVLDTPEFARVRGFDEFAPFVPGLERHFYRLLT